MADRTLLLKLVADVSSVAGSVKKAETAVSKFGSTVKGIGVGLVAGFGLDVAVDMMGKAIDKASDLAEQQSKVGAVFGDSAQQVQSWAHDLDKSFGITETAALTAAGNIGNLAESMGLSEDASAKMSEKVTELAGDLSSFNNVPVEDVLNALQSGLVGESEPMRKFGVLLSDAAVNAEALASGLAPTKAAITDAVKVQARYNIILRQTTKAQGDAAKTGDTYAGKQRALNVTIDDMWVKVGKVGLALAGPLVDGLSMVLDLFTGPEGASARFREFSLVLGDTAKTIGDVHADALAKDLAAVNSSLLNMQQNRPREITDFLNLFTPEQIQQLGQAAGVAGDVMVENLGVMAEVFVENRRFADQWSDAFVADARRVAMGTEAYLGVLLPGAFAKAEPKVSTATGGIVNDINDIGEAAKSLPPITAEAMADLAFALKNPDIKDAAQRVHDWIMEPFIPVKRQLRNVGKDADDAVAWGLAHHKGRVVRRGREIANAVTNPLVIRLVALGHTVDEAIAKLWELKNLGRSIEPNAIVVTGAGRSADNTFEPPPETPAQRRRRLRLERMARRNRQGAGGGATNSGTRSVSGLAASASAFGATTAGWALAGSSASRLGGGGNTYNLTVNGAIDPYSTGKTVIRAIKAYESREGKRWRATTA